MTVCTASRTIHCDLSVEELANTARNPSINICRLLEVWIDLLSVSFMYSMSSTLAISFVLGSSMVLVWS